MSGPCLCGDPECSRCFPRSPENDERCRHERLEEDGICRACGEDRRGA